MKTIKQIADELGIDKQRVYRHIRKNHINEAHQKNGVMYYDEKAQELITQHFLKTGVSDEAHHEAHQTASSDAVIDTVIAMLQRELDIKNKQIEELTAALAATTSSLQTAQALHAGTIHKQLTDGGADPADVTTNIPADATAKKPWWQFW